MATRRSLAVLSTCLLLGGFQQIAAAQATPEQTALPLPTTAAESRAQIRDLFVQYLRLHAAKEMNQWAALFLPGAIAVRTGRDGRVETYTDMKKFAAEIAEAAKSLEEQHETFEQVKISVDGDAGVYETLYSLYHNHKKIQQGRVWFSVVRVQGAWKIAAFVWYKH